MASGVKCAYFWILGAFSPMPTRGVGLQSPHLPHIYTRVFIAPWHQGLLTKQTCSAVDKQCELELWTKLSPKGFRDLYTQWHVSTTHCALCLPPSGMPSLSVR